MTDAIEIALEIEVVGMDDGAAWWWRTS